MKKNRLFTDDIFSLIPSNGDFTAMEWLADQMPGGFFIYRADKSTQLLFVNQATCDIFGCDSVEDFRSYVGDSFRGMVHPDDYDIIQDSIDDQIASLENSHNMDYVIYRIIRKDGQIRWVDDYGHFATIPGFGDVYYVFIGDITETRLAAEEKERSRALAEALETAEQANIAKSAFLSNMSHEIRTPITAILGMNEMIRREAKETDILEYSENIRKAGMSLLGIISDILDFSKIEMGHMELDNEEYTLSSVVTDLYNLVHFRAEEKGLNFVISIDPALPSRLVGDTIRIKQIITNLLTNAVKYTETGSIVFEMKRVDLSDKTVKIRVSVSDTGIGIRKNDMEKLFEPFDRLDLKKTRSIEGSGLGLAITRQLLTIMNSKLSVDSEYGRGSVFSFLLTQQVTDDTPVGELDPAALLHESVLHYPRLKHFQAPGKRILLVDDTPMNLQVIAGLLKRTLMQIDVAVSGVECIEKFGISDYDLVFLDYRMPQMNGIETLHEIARLYPDKFKKTPIISLTASAVSGDKEKMLAAGFTDYLSKPVNIDEMERMMSRYLPADAVIFGEDDSTSEEDEYNKLPCSVKECDILDARLGLSYCGDADDYLYALETYASSIDAKADLIEFNLLQGDIDAYILNVHSLKNTSESIGAMGLFYLAKSLESAARKNNIKRLQNDTPILLKLYKEAGEELALLE